MWILSIAMEALESTGRKRWKTANTVWRVKIYLLQDR